MGRGDDVDVTTHADGSYEYTFDGYAESVVMLQRYETMTRSVSFTITDDMGNSDTGYLVFTIHGINSAPVATGAVVEITVDTNSYKETKFDLANALTRHGDGHYTVSITKSSGSTGDLAYKSRSTVVTLKTPAGLYESLSPDAEYIDVYDFTPADIDGESTSAKLRVKYTVADRAPVRHELTVSVSADSPSASGNIFDILKLGNGTAAAHKFAWTGSSVSNFGTITLGKDGSYSFTLDASCVAYTNLDNSSTVESFEYRVEDIDGDTVIGTFDIHIQGRKD